MSGWGMDVHRLITEKAIDGLPPELKPFFTPERAFISEHAVDPDLWRVMDLKGDRGDEPPNHFLDMDKIAALLSVSDPVYARAQLGLDRQSHCVIGSRLKVGVR